MYENAHIDPFSTIPMLAKMPWRLGENPESNWPGGAWLFLPMCHSGELKLETYKSLALQMP